MTLTEPAAFRRLCVETSERFWSLKIWQPAAFRRLCVETPLIVRSTTGEAASRLQAAVC